MEFENIIWAIAGAIWLITTIRKGLKAKAQPAQLADDDADELEWQDSDWADDANSADDPDPHHLPQVAARPVPDTHQLAPLQSAARTRFLDQVDKLIREADALVTVARVDWATTRIAQTIDDFVLPRAKHIRAEAVVADESLLPQLEIPLEELELIFGVVETMIQQRNSSTLRKDLGDADKLAAACYQPIVDFATAGRIQLTTSTPVTMLVEKFDLGIWTGFIPTGIAPIFLPPYFLNSVVWWPALAHEVAHDFLAAATGAEARIRVQLGLPSQEIGLQFLNIGAEGLTFHELYKLFGGWFEEIFCDVFATLMLGPSYGYTMVELFASPQDPGAVARVNLDPKRPMLGEHPPRHLRLKTVANVLSLVEEHEAAAELLAEWEQIHGQPESIDIPLRRGGAVTVPMAVMEELLGELCSLLYREQLHGLNGHALFDIPGVDYGPHEAAEVRRVRDELIAGRVPADHHARAVIGGLVLAWRQAKHRESEFLGLAHHAIVGVTEHREDLHEDAYAVDRRAPSRTAAGSASASQLDALILHTLLGPPISVRNMGRPKGAAPAGVGKGIVQARHRAGRS